MRCVFGLIVIHFAILTGADAHPLNIFNGIWMSFDPPGSRAGLNTCEASPRVIGQAALRVSDGENGSNFFVPGEGFSCKYFVGKINALEMTWEPEGGSTVCFPSAHFKKDPP